MPRHSPRWTRRTALGQALVPAALLALVALIGGLTWHVRRSEASHLATAQGALRDYAGFAAWLLTRNVEAKIQMAAHNRVHEVDHLYRYPAPRPTLPSPDTLLATMHSAACDCGRSPRFAFRVDLPSGEVRLAGRSSEPPDAATLAIMVSRLRVLAGAPATLGNGARFLVDTIDGVRYAIAWVAALDADSTVVALYGVDGDFDRLLAEIRSAVRERDLLPPSLLAGRPIEEVMTLSVALPYGEEVHAFGAGAAGGIAASQRTAADAGGIVTTVTIPAHSARTLLIGGLPSSPLPMLVAVLVAAGMLAGVALVQLRRGRELARLRTRFVANVSHELRTPLAQISMFSETLLLGRERSGDERQQFLSVIYREARRLAQLVESVLSFSRAEAGQRPLRLEPRELTDEVRDTVRAFSPMAAAADVDVVIEAHAPAWSLVEAGALRQVVINLLDNALKFGPAGQRVRISVERAGSENVLTVDDQGPGIPPALRTRVFEPFAQGDQAGAGAAPGAGIGLAVVAELVTAQRGRVWIADSPEGRGTRVCVAFPVIEPPAGDPATVDGSADRQGAVPDGFARSASA